MADSRNRPKGRDTMPTTRKECPYCGTNVFHRAVHVNLEGDQEVEVRREYRCIGCNNIFDISMLRDREVQLIVE